MARAIGVTIASAQPRPMASMGLYARAWEKLSHDPVTIAAAIVLFAIIVVTLLAPTIAEHILHTSPDQMMRGPVGRFAFLKPPGDGFPLGTDDLGRDSLTRLLYAGRVSLSIGFDR